MLVIGMVFALLTVGFVVPCMIDAVRTPQFAIRSLSKRTWVLLILLLSVIGAVAWLIAGRPAGSWQAPMANRPLAGLPGIRRQEAFRRHPAGRGDDLGFDFLAGYQEQPDVGRPLGPDDDIDFLRELDRRIRGDREAGNDA
jgi:hypothetical protein